ncbi:MAG: DinB family protein [Actinomycetota bacterium]
MTDPLLVAARRAVTESFDELRRSVDGLPGPALDWRPAGTDTNSLAVLVTHSMNSTRLLMRVAVGLPPPKRDREAEFQAKSADPAALLAMIDDLAVEITTALDSVETVDWSALEGWTRASGEVVEFTRAYALIHGAEHLRGHVDQASLTRHLWEGRK